MGLSTQTSYHQPPLSSIGIDTKYNPAYEGARFDTSGYCLKHPMIRLCKPVAPSNNNASTTSSHLLSLKKKSPKDESFDESPASSSNGSEEGDDSAMPKFKYIIIRKTCPMCGEHNLRNERKMNKQSWAHGYEMPKLMERKSCKNTFVGLDTHHKFVRQSSCGSHRNNYHPNSPYNNNSPKMLLTDTPCTQASTPPSVYSNYSPTETKQRSKKDFTEAVRMGIKSGNLPPPPTHFHREAPSRGRASSRSVVNASAFEKKGSLRSVSRDSVRTTMTTQESGRTVARDSSLSSRRNRDSSVNSERRRLQGAIPDQKGRLLPSSSSTEVLSQSRQRSHSQSSRKSVGYSRRHTLDGTAVSTTTTTPSSSSNRRLSRRHSSITSNALGLGNGSDHCSAADSASSTVYRSNTQRRSREPSPSRSRERSSSRSRAPSATRSVTPSSHTPSSSSASVKTMPYSARSVASPKPSSSKPKHTTPSFFRGRAASVLSSSMPDITSDSSGGASMKEETIIRGRSLFSKNSNNGSRSRSRSNASKLQDHISKHSATNDDNDTATETVASSAMRSFKNSIRRRSLSRNSKRVLKTTSSMDGHEDDEPSTLRYEVPFNPSTGKCNYHSDVSLAVKNTGGRGGWKIIRDECPKCRH
eukprot:g8753.t1 g8753   contig34:30329-32345(+)